MPGTLLYSMFPVFPFLCSTYLSLVFFSNICCLVFAKMWPEAVLMDMMV